MLEAINLICEQAGELARAQIIIDNKDRQIAQMEEHITKQGDEVKLLNNEIGSMRQAANAARPAPGASPAGNVPARQPIDHQA